MEEKKMPASAVEAIGNWAAEDINKHVAFCVAATIDGCGISCSSSLMGRSDKVAFALANLAKNKEEFAQVLKIAARAIESETEYMALGMSATSDGLNPDGKNNDLIDALKGLVDALKVRIKHD